MSRILTDQEVTNLANTLLSVAMPENFRTLVETLVSSHIGLLNERPPTPLQAAALAALVAWREADAAVEASSDLDWWEFYTPYVAAEAKLRAATDALLAAEGGTG